MGALIDVNTKSLTSLGTSFAIDVNSETPYLFAWVRIPTVASLASDNYWAELGVGSIFLEGRVANLTGAVRGQVGINNAGTVGSAATFAQAAWGNVMVSYGPRNNVSRQRQVWVGGTLTNTGLVTNQTGIFNNL
jgi:hypothetical protein